MDKVKTPEQREWYIRKTAENGWSHSVLIHQIESGLYQRQAIADKINNFENRLPAPQSELAVQTMKLFLIEMKTGMPFGKNSDLQFAKI